MRSNVSATAGVVVGVVCKIGSVLLNLMIWDQHASPVQLGFLALGLAGGSLFQQAPMREVAVEALSEKLPLIIPVKGGGRHVGKVAAANAAGGGGGEGQLANSSR